jgi:hypothetical protein
MSLVAYLILLFLTGLIVGGLARLALPGRDPVSRMRDLPGVGRSSFVINNDLSLVVVLSD